MSNVGSGAESLPRLLNPYLAGSYIPHCECDGGKTEAGGCRARVAVRVLEWRLVSMARNGLRAATGAKCTVRTVIATFPPCAHNVGCCGFLETYDKCAEAARLTVGD